MRRAKRLRKAARSWVEAISSALDRLVASRVWCEHGIGSRRATPRHVLDQRAGSMQTETRERLSLDEERATRCVPLRLVLPAINLMRRKANAPDTEKRGGR